MKIVCSSCKKVIGQKDPYEDPSEVLAKCPECFTQEKQEKERLSRELEAKGKNGIVTLENGLKGVLTIVGKESKELNLFEINVEGKDFFCIKEGREDFLKYLDGISNDEVEVTFLHSISCTLERPPRKRKGQKEEPPKPGNSESTHYNCTVKIPKYYARLFFEDKAERSKVFSDFMAEALLKQYREEQTAAKTTENTPMSASSGRTEP